MNQHANQFEPEDRRKESETPDSRTRVRVPTSAENFPLSEGSSRSNSLRKPLGPVPVEEKTVISKRPPAVEAPVIRPALNPFELGRTLEGRRLGHFQLEQFVGGGGMGAVFRATDTMLGRTVAVKVLSRDQTDEETLRRFQNEAQSAARLDHPNIARVYYVGEDQGLHYIVFEFIEGDNIRDLVVAKGPLPVEDAVNYTLQVAEALEHAAHRDVVHRDIKPSNVLVMPNGHVKLVDMGLARLHQVETSAADLTESGVTLGTFDYISPEQARDPRAADVRSDLYSLGCTLFFMLTGRPPFPDGTVLQKLLSHSSDPPPDLRSLRPDLTAEICAVVNKLLAKQPAQRYQQPNELIGALLLVAEQMGFGDVMRGTVWVTSAESERPWYERHLPWAIPLAVLLVIAGVLKFSAAPATQISQEDMRPRYNDRVPSAIGEKMNSAETPKTVPAQPTNRDPVQSSGSSTDTNSATERSLNRSSGTVDVAPPRIGDALVTSADASNNTKQTDSEPNAIQRLNVPADSAEPRAVTNPSATASGTAVLDDPNAVSMLVIANTEDSLPSDARLAKSFAEAIRLCDDYPNVNVLELRFNGERSEVPFELPARKWTIRAGSGFKPVVAFRPEQGELALDRRMIRASAGEIVLQGIHLRMELPSQPYDGWSMIHLTHGVGLDIADCSLTVRNADDSGGALQERVAFVEIVPPMTSETNKAPLAGGGEMNIIMSRAAPPVISIANSIVRGQATILDVAEALPLRLTISQSLITTTRRLIELGGARQQPTLSDVVQVDLRHVTAFVGDGLGYSKIDQEAGFPLEFVLTSHNCIILTGGNAPLLEQRGTAALPYKKRPNIRGTDNFYPNTKSILLIDATGNTNDLVEYTFSERDEARQEKWYDDQPVPGMVQWKRPPSSGLRVDQHTKDDYLFTPGSDDKMLQTAGFDPLHLVDLPTQ